ncbi:hypothetical protein MMC13_004552 [Lambiella insularis]|nr:hypothetical protein [Lambiella insularis]
MQETSAVSLQSFAPRRHSLNPFHGFHTNQAQLVVAPYGSPIDPHLQDLDTSNAFAQQCRNQLEDSNDVQSLHANDPFQRDTAPKFQEGRTHVTPPLPNRSRPPGQFGILTPHAPPLPQHVYFQHDAVNPTQIGTDLLQSTQASGGSRKKDGHFDNAKSIPNPPNLQAWRERLFHVNETITLSEDDFLTYFPHIDNVYSHRSTQKYKRKPFVSHYWDCRLKGRPPGTAKSDDPTKRKRKRQARERDLCDVKIKITEYFPGARAMLGQEITNTNADPNGRFYSLGRPEVVPLESTQPHPFGVIAPTTQDPANLPGNNGERFFTIQRVNGNGGNGKGDGVAGPHKHSLEESDRVKKNTVQRQILKDEKDTKKVQSSGKKTYHKKATGAALGTVKRHSKEHELKLFGSCFCPFVQRVWIALEVKDMDYQYIEVDPYKKPQSLLEVNPEGLVPALRHGDWACYESTVLLEYLEDLNGAEPLLPHENAPKRAHCRLWADHINRKIVPAFYRYLQAQEASKQVEGAEDLKLQIAKLVEAADPVGPFFLGPRLGFVDVQLAPWLLRMRRVLKPYRSWPDPIEGSRWAKWVEAVENNVHVKATTSTDDLYLDSYERYAENRPNTSRVADAVNAGRGLP